MLATDAFSDRKWLTLSGGDPTTSGLTILSFNLLSDAKKVNESWLTPPKDFKERKAVILRNIEAADICGLQEVDRSFFDELSEHFKAKFESYFYKPEWAPTGLSVFLRKSKANAKPDSIVGKEFAQTMCQYVVVDYTGATSGSFHFLNMHLRGGKEDKDEADRAGDMALAKADILDKFEGSTPCVITVDSNGERIFAPKEKLAPQWYPWMEANLLIKEGEVASGAVKFSDPLLKANLKYTTKKKRGENAITERCVDYIFLSTVLECQAVLDVPRDGDTVKENYMPNDEYVSDHLPIFVNVKL